jgi:hypothetical protein
MLHTDTRSYEPYESDIFIPLSEHVTNVHICGRWIIVSWIEYIELLTGVVKFNQRVVQSKK